MKRTICKGCSSLLIPGVTATIRSKRLSQTTLSNNSTQYNPHTQLHRRTINWSKSCVSTARLRDGYQHHRYCRVILTLRRAQGRPCRSMAREPKDESASDPGRFTNNRSSNAQNTSCSAETRWWLRRKTPRRMKRLRRRPSRYEKDGCDLGWE